MKNLLIALGFVIGFTGGVAVAHSYSNNDDTIGIDGKRVKVVNVMYTYENENGEIIEGDYSLSTKNGFEYSTSSDYYKDYENAVLVK